MLSAHHLFPLSLMANKMLIIEKEEKVNQFQVGYLLNPELNSDKAFKETFEINLAKSFSGATMMPSQKNIKKETHSCSFNYDIL